MNIDSLRFRFLLSLIGELYQSRYFILFQPAENDVLLSELCILRTKVGSCVDIIKGCTTPVFLGWVVILSSICQGVSVSVLLIVFCLLMTG